MDIAQTVHRHELAHLPPGRYRLREDPIVGDWFDVPTATMRRNVATVAVALIRPSQGDDDAIRGAERLDRRPDGQTVIVVRMVSSEADAFCGEGMN